MKSLVIHWFRRDLRTADNPALSAAISRVEQDPHAEFLPLFTVEEYMCADDPKHQFGRPSRIVLSKALPPLAERFRLFALCRGKGARTIIDLAQAIKGTYRVEVHVNEDIYPDFYSQCEKIRAAGISLTIHADRVTVPLSLRTTTGNVYAVFTPFQRAAWDALVGTEVLEAPPIKTVPFAHHLILSHLNTIEPKVSTLESLFPRTRHIRIGTHVIDINTHISYEPDLSREVFDEDSAMERFERFVQTGGLRRYASERDRLDIEGTSCMSTALAWGFISPRQLIALMREHRQLSDKYVSEIMWREFYGYVLYHDHGLLTHAYRKEYDHMALWVDDHTALERFKHWIAGTTGYPLVDAAMRELAMTGRMHNRARMVVASILTKNLGVDWRWGQEYFRAMLVDLDEASNNGGWQWSASVGVDPKPIRIFNPYLQAKNYDPRGVYQKKWLRTEDWDIAPIVEHTIARTEALKRYGLGRDTDA